MSTCRCKRVALAPILAIATAGVFLGGLQPALAQDSSTTSRVQIHINDDDNGVTVRTKNGTVRTADYVRFGESVHVQPDESIVGDVVVIANDLLVEGKVSGDCVAIGGDLELGPGAVVDGEVVCVGGTLTLADSSHVGMSVTSVWGDLDKSDSAKVEGEVSVVGGPRINLGDNVSLSFGGTESSIWKFVTRFVWVLVLVFLGILAYYIFPSRMRRLADTIEHRGLVSFLAGLAGWILWLPVFILLCVTLVGIPVALLLIVLTPLMTLVGYLGVAMSVGRKTGARMFGGVASGAGTMLIGVFILEGSILLGDLFRAFPSVFQLLGVILCVIGISVIFIAGTMGFGAFLMTRFRPEQAPPPGAAVPPPPPETPPIATA